MFAAVMADSENCRELLEMVLGIKIAKIKVWAEKIIIYNPAAKFVGPELEESEDDYGDAYVEKLQYAIQKVKHDRELEERYMLFQELLDEREEKGREEGRKEGIIEGKAEEIFSSVFCGDYSRERGAEKMNLPIAEFTEKYKIWLIQKEKI